MTSTTQSSLSAAGLLGDSTLFALAFDDAALSDESSNGLAVTHGSADSVVDGAYVLNGQHLRDGGNYIGIERNDALFSRDAMSISLNFKAADAGDGGSLFRMHTALHIDVTDDGAVVFNLLENSAGESGVIRSQGVNATDGEWHQLTLTYDAPAGVMRGYVDGAEVGEIAVSGATQMAKGWGPMIGEPWGRGFTGTVDEFAIGDRALSAEEVQQLYASFSGEPVPEEPGEDPDPVDPDPEDPGSEDPGSEDPDPQPEPESPALFRLAFDDGSLADESGSGIPVTHGSADSIADGAYLLNGEYANGGGNYIAVERNEDLFARDEMSIRLNFKAAEAGEGGHLFRMHTALHIDVTDDGDVVFNLFDNSAGDTGIIRSQDLGVTDGEWHQLVMTYDAPAGVMRGYVDGESVGEIDISGATSAAAAWDPMVGSPWGNGFAGAVDDFVIDEQALTAEQVSQLYDEFRNGPQDPGEDPEDPGEDPEEPGNEEPAPQEPDPAGTALFQLAFDNGQLADESGNGLRVTHGSADSVVDDGYLLNGQHLREGGNYLSIERNQALFSRDEMSISLDFKSAEPGAGGNIFRIHTALNIDVTTDGQVVFNLLANSAGENGVIRSQDLDVADGEWHRLTLNYDAPDGVMRGYVDGEAVGEIAVSAATKAAESWDPMIGQPWGGGFRGYVDNVEIRDAVGDVSNGSSPIARADEATMEEDAVLTIPAATLLANDESPDGSALSVTDVRVASGEGSVELDSNGDVVFTPAADANGPMELEYTVASEEGGRGTGTVNVNVTPVNDAPAATGGAFSVSSEAAAGTAVGTIAADDVDGDALTFEIADGNPDGAFAINDEGQIVVNNAGSLKEAGGNVQDLSVVVSDPAGESTTVGAQVTISDDSQDPQDPGGPPSDSIIVGSSAELVSALQGASGGETILLRSGNYSASIKNIDPGSNVTIGSLDSDKPATFTTLELSSTANLTFEDLTFKNTGARHTFDVRLTNTENIRFTDSTFDGPATTYAGGGGLIAQNLALVRESDGFTFDNNDVSGYLHGLSVLNSSNTSIHDNTIHHLQGDGLRFGQVNGVTIEDNLVRDFLGSDYGITHGDYIQFWTTNTTAPSSDVEIRGNAFLSDFHSQAIFMTDQLGNMRYKDVLIEDNVIYNNQHHGITVANADGAVVRANTLITHPEPGATDASINVHGSTGVQVYDNVTPRFHVTPENQIARMNDNIDYIEDPSFVDTQFVNAGKGVGATLADLQVSSSGELVKSDGTVFGSEQLNPSAQAGTSALESEALVSDDESGFAWTSDADGEQADSAEEEETDFQVMQTVLQDEESTDAGEPVAPMDSVLASDDDSAAVRPSDQGDIWPS